jgi:hypothetical protein
MIGMVIQRLIMEKRMDHGSESVEFKY